MLWRIIHGRQRDQMLAGVRDGRPEFTRDRACALKFDSQAAARQWIGSNALTAFGSLALMREAADRDTRRGVASHYRPRATP